MPISKVSDELKTFLEETSSFPESILKISASLRKIKRYADSQGIEFRFYQRPSGPFLKYEERRLSEKGIFALTSLSFAVFSDKGVKKIVLHPKKYSELILEDKKRWLGEFVFICLHEIVHLQKAVIKAAMIQGGKGAIIECPYSETSCIEEEIETIKDIWKLYCELKIRKSKEDFTRFFLKGIFIPAHQNCFEAIDGDVCPLKDIIKKDKNYQNCIKPILDGIDAERIKPEQNP